MLEREINLIRWLSKELATVFILFFVIPYLIILALAGVITGITWKILLALALGYLAFWLIAKLVIKHTLKKAEKNALERLNKENELKYVIIK